MGTQDSAERSQERGCAGSAPDSPAPTPSRGRLWGPLKARARTGGRLVCCGHTSVPAAGDARSLSAPHPTAGPRRFLQLAQPAAALPGEPSLGAPRGTTCRFLVRDHPLLRLSAVLR